MECNKDEAIRAREIAERKMQNNDFSGAKRFALKAQQLYANLDSISMILAVCEVHCSAQNKIIGPGVNWYDVLQVEKIADETTIKKQYRKLALLLHPDKNKFAGAEAAFKLIGEANRVLSNKMTRQVFDSQVKASTQTSTSAKPPFRPSSGSPSVNKKQNSEDNIHSTFTQQSTNNGRQPKSHIFRQTTEKFWTRCPCCKTSYEYYKFVVGKQLSCQTCRTTFIAYETVAPVGRSNANSSQSECFSDKGNVSSSHKVPEAAGRDAEIDRKSNGHSVRNSMPTPPTKAGFSVSNSEQKRNDTDGDKLGAQKKGPKSGVRKPVMAKASRNTSKRRRRPGVVESSQSSDGVDDVDVRAEVNQESDGNFDTKRPCRNRRNASYRESMSDDSNFVESPKLPETVHSDTNEEAHMGKRSENDLSKASATISNVAESVKHNTQTSYKENVSNKKGKLKKQSVNSVEEDKVDLFEENDTESDIALDTSPVHYDCPDPEFSDFDKDKEKSCFEVDQIWAVYDTVDAMPRFYAQIKKVYAPDFKLQITWLEADAGGESNAKWTDAGLPTACGMFKYGNTEVTTDYLMFSHQMRFEAGRKRSSVVIYPRSGEVWALFRNWDIGWANDPQKNKPYKFDFVVVLSDFDEKEGIEVAYLKKLRGFVSLFQQTIQEGRSSFRIPPGNLFQFSHRVPYFQMSGNERDDVPLGSYELDTASLPNEFDELDDFTEGKMENEKKDTARAVSHKQSTEIHEKLRAASGSVETRGSSKKCHLDDANQGSTNVKNVKDMPKGAQWHSESGMATSNQHNDCSVIPPRNPTTVVRRSPRVSSRKKTSNPNVA